MADRRHPSEEPDRRQAPWSGAAEERLAAEEGAGASSAELEAHPTPAWLLPPERSAAGSLTGLHRVLDPAIWQDIPVGTVVGEYQIVGRIAEGGMGTVYAAVQPVIGKRVAVKVIRPDLSANPVAVERFLQEARTVTQVSHPNIIQIFSFGALPDGRTYFVMEWLHGQSLAERLRAGRPGVAEAIDILAQMARGLRAAHDAGIVHRDLKPDNVFLADTGQERTVKLLDFGIAKLVSATPRARRLTGTGMMMGTPDYMSPEQARDRDVGPHSDIYAVGVIAYEMLLGRPPFSADNSVDMVYRHLHHDPPPPSVLWPEIPPALDELLRRMMHKQPGRRPSTTEIIDTVYALAEQLCEERSVPASDAQLLARLRPSGTLRERARLATGTLVPPLATPPVPGRARQSWWSRLRPRGAAERREATLLVRRSRYGVLPLMVLGLVTGGAAAIGFVEFGLRAAPSAGSAALAQPAIPQVQQMLLVPVRIETDTDGAIAVVDGREREFTGRQLELELPEGMHDIAVRAGVSERRRQVSLLAGHPVHLSFRLQAPPLPRAAPAAAAGPHAAQPSEEAVTGDRAARPATGKPRRPARRQLGSDDVTIDPFAGEE
jgi:serine/threonine protein kinase